MPRGRPRTQPTSAPKSALAEVLDYDTLKELAGTRSFTLGEDYYRQGAVRKVIVNGDKLTATVEGTERYKVVLKTGEGELDYRCSCPWYEETDEFCKHCVAAGLAYLRGEVHLDVGQGKGYSMPRHGSNLETLRIWLESQESEDLVDLIMEMAMNDDNALEFLSSRMHEETD